MVSWVVDAAAVEAGALDVADVTAAALPAALVVESELPKPNNCLYLNTLASALDEIATTMANTTTRHHEYFHVERILMYDGSSRP